MKTLACSFALAALLGGCGSWQYPTRLGGDIPRKGTVVPDTALKMTPTLAVPLEKVIYWGIYASAAYLIVDPMAPNWEIEEARFPEERYHLALHMKRFYAGGAGEARAIFHRRARDLAQRGGFAGYEVLEYSEGLESSVIGSQRTATGVVVMTKANG